MMNVITLLNPNKVVFGVGALQAFKTDYLQTGCNRLFLLTLPFLLDSLAEILDYLKNNGISFEVDTSIQNEPTFEELEIIIKKAKDFNADSVVGIGGGSVLDVSKLVAAQLKNSQSLIQTIGIGNLKERKTYLACIPTTAGTGSEVSPNAIFIDEDGNKIGVISFYLVPDASYVDPALTLSIPPAITASTGIDALTHCIEAYANKFAHPITNLFAIEGIRLISGNLIKAYTNGSNLEARSNVALGSLYGGMCLGPVNTAAVHALSYPLGVEFHIAHGLSNALLLPHVMEFNLSHAEKEYSEIAVAMGVERSASDKETAKKGIDKLKDLNKACNIPSRLSELNIPRSALDKLAKSALEVQRLLKNNLKSIDLEDAKRIYHSAY